MQLRAYAYGADFGRIESWVADERTHAFWCAGRFSRPLTRGDFEDRLRELTEESGLRAFVAETEEDGPVGFLCTSPGPAEGETTLKYVVIDPSRRGKGFGREMVSLASEASGAPPERRARQTSQLPQSALSSWPKERSRRRERHSSVSEA